MALGAKIKELREARHWTQLDLARKSSLTRSHISSIENNKIPNPGVGAIVSLAKALKVSEDVLFEAAGIKLHEATTGDPVAAAIDDPELRKWFTAKNINSLPVETKKAIAAIIRDVIEEREKNLNSLAELAQERKDHAADLLKSADANPEAYPDYRENSIRIKQDMPDEIANLIRRFKEDTLEVAGGVLISLEELEFLGFWPKPSQDSNQAIAKLENFYKKGPEEYWESDSFITWMYNLPEYPVSQRNVDSNRQSIIRLDLNIIREDKVKFDISFWFDGVKHYKILKAIYTAETILPLPGPFDIQTYIPTTPCIALDQTGLDVLGECLANFARIYGLNEPELIAKYPLKESIDV